MKIVLLKDTMHGKAKETVTVSYARAIYLIKCNRAVKYVAPIKKEKNDDKPTVTRKSKAKS